MLGKKLIGACCVKLALSGAKSLGASPPDSTAAIHTFRDDASDIASFVLTVPSAIEALQQLMLFNCWVQALSVRNSSHFDAMSAAVQVALVITIKSPSELLLKVIKVGVVAMAIAGVNVGTSYTRRANPGTKVQRPPASL